MKNSSVWFNLIKQAIQKGCVYSITKKKSLTISFLLHLLIIIVIIISNYTNKQNQFKKNIIDVTLVKNSETFRDNFIRKKIKSDQQIESIKKKFYKALMKKKVEQQKKIEQQKKVEQQ